MKDDEDDRDIKSGALLPFGGGGPGVAWKQEDVKPVPCGCGQLPSTTPIDRFPGPTWLVACYDCPEGGYGIHTKKDVAIEEWNEQIEESSNE